MSSMQTKIWFYYSSGKEYGPFNPDGIIERARTGEITPDTLVRRQGRDYCEAHNLSFLATAFDDAHTTKPRRNHDGDVVRTGKPTRDKVVSPPVPDSNGSGRDSVSPVPPPFPDSIDSNKGARSPYPLSKALPVQKPAESSREVRAKALAKIIGLSLLIFVLVVGNGMVFLAPFLSALKRSQKDVEQPPWNDNQLAEQFVSGLPPKGFSQDGSPEVKAPGTAQQPWQEVALPGVGKFKIPPTMEIQGGLFANLVGELREGMLGPDESSKSVVIQQRGLNDFKRTARDAYMRLIVEVSRSSEESGIGQEHLRAFSPADLKEVDELLKQALIEQFAEAKLFGKEARLLEWNSVRIARFNHHYALNHGYRRQLGDNPSVVVQEYLVPLDDILCKITVSYRESERPKWADDLAKVIASFEFDWRQR